MTELTCADGREVAAEAALELLPGDERTRLFEHLERCLACRSVVEGYMRTVDTMLVALPEVEVPAALAARLRMAVPTDHRSGRVPARPRRRVVAASLVAAAAVMIGVRTASDHTYREPNTQAAAALVAPGSGRVGSVEMHAGRAPWIVMNLDGNLPDGEFHCDVVLADGTVRTIGRVVVSHGVGWWKGSLDVDPSLIDEVRVVAATGSIVAAARPDQSQRNAATS